MALAGLDQGQHERSHRVKGDLRPEIRELRLTGGQHRGGRSEHIAAVESRPFRRDAELGVAQFDHGVGSPHHRHGRRQQPVVGSHEVAPLRTCRDRTAVGAHARVHDREHHPVRQVLDGAQQRQRPRLDVAAGHAVGDVDHADLGVDACDDAVNDADELVVVAEVGEE